MTGKTELPQTMTAIAISQPGGPEVLKPQLRPVPQAGPDEILIRVRAAGVNRPDIAQRNGSYPPPPGASDLPGLEVAGEVAALGENAGRWRIGDPVCALTAGGGYAQYVAVHASHVLPLPSGFSFHEAAAVPETYFTVWHNVFERGRLQAGETLLVHGGSSGIGTTAIQLGKARGARVIATAGSAQKCAACVKLGAERVINYREEDFVSVVRQVTQGKGANVILDMVGGDYVERNYIAAAIEGRIVQIAVLGGAKTSANFARLMAKRLVHTGSTLRPRSDVFKGRLALALETEVWPLLASRRVAPVMDMIFPLQEAQQAHERLESGQAIGKIVLEVA
ncbi:NAD(P)H-quinone oxidoreductase [Aquamicrobium segne]|uniref:NAD(P)H-quinone oxidoreductase n=1 Tax=Aquamicrobium segne TaxID=469547 RepID=A0ABW0GVL2_9HYPH